jgi:hypothetical protein
MKHQERLTTLSRGSDQQSWSNPYPAQCCQSLLTEYFCRVLSTQFKRFQSLFGLCLLSLSLGRRICGPNKNVFFFRPGTKMWNLTLWQHWSWPFITALPKPLNNININVAVSVSVVDPEPDPKWLRPGTQGFGSRSGSGMGLIGN